MWRCPMHLEEPGPLGRNTAAPWRGALLGLVGSLLAPELSAGPQVTEAYALRASDGFIGNSYGRDLAAEGSCVVVGALGAVPAGAAYVYDVGDGTELCTLRSLDGEPGDYLGFSIAVHGDRALLGAFGDDDFGDRSGSAYVFELQTGQQLVKLQALDGFQEDQFGYAVALSDAFAVVGANLEDALGDQAGSVYVFDLASGQQLYKLNAPDGATLDYFGHALALEGTTLLVGAYGDDDLGSFSGSAYVFDITTGQLLSKLTAPDGAAGDQFGYSVALDAGVALIGAFGHDAAGDNAGAAYLFDAASGLLLSKLLATDGEPEDYFGLDLDLDDGLALIGAYGDDDQGGIAGAAYRFDASTGQQLSKLQASDGATLDVFGYAVATTGGTSFVGGPGINFVGAPEIEGRVGVFDPPTIGTSYCVAAPNSTGAPARIRAYGSDEAVANLLVLDADGLPPQQFGYFLTGQVPGFVGGPGGSQGNLCLIGQIGRFVAPGQVQSSGASRRIQLQLDLTNLPIGAGQAVAPGETWNFTLWYRDENPGPTSNFTDAVGVTFR